MFRDWIFYPLIALAAAGMIALSFGPAPWRPAPAAQAGDRQEGALVFTPDALEQIEPRGAVTSVSYAGWSPTAVRIATPPGQGEPGAATPAARLQLSADAGQALAGKALIVELLVRPVPLSTAPNLAVAITRGGAQSWARTEIGAEPALVTFKFEAAPGPVEAIALYPINPSQDRPLSVEIGEIRVRTF